MYRLSTLESSLTAFCPKCGESCTTNSRRPLKNCGACHHNPNCRTFYFRCTEGHRFKVRPVNFCPNCDWEGTLICDVCGPPEAVIIKEGEFR